MSLYSKTPDPARLQYALEFLQDVAPFVGLDQEQLALCAARMHRRTYAPGVTLFHQDMPGIMMYVLEEGAVRVFGTGLTGQEHTFNTFGPGDIFGELSVLDGKNRSASAITMSPCVVWLLAKQDFDVLVQQLPSFAREMLIILATRIRTAASHVESIIFQDVMGRLAYELIILAERHGYPDGSAVQLDVPLTQSDLASMVGATRESVNKALSTLRARNLVEMDGMTVTVLNKEGLHRVLQERGR